MDQGDRHRLADLYRATEYCVDDPRLRCVLRIDQPSAELAGWLQARGYDCAAFITAWNPRSQLRPEGENRRALGELQQVIEALGLPALTAVGRSRAEAYAEPSLLVPGLSPEVAQALMRRFEQNAFLGCDAEGRPTLCWTEGLPR